MAPGRLRLSSLAFATFGLPLVVEADLRQTPRFAMTCAVVAHAPHPGEVHRDLLAASEPAHGAAAAAETVPAMRSHAIVFEPNEYGGRLKFYDRASAPEFWDEQWDAKEVEVNYARHAAGHLPAHLDRALRRWVPAEARVLEAGCGLGRFTVAARARGYRAEGVDYAPHVIDRLRARFPDVPFFLGDVTRLVDVADASYDAVYSPGVVEHFEAGPEAALRETRRILAPGGCALVHTPCFNPFRRWMASHGAFRERPSGSFYQYAFSRAELEARVRSVGFEIVDWTPFDALQTLRDHVAGIAGLTRGRLGGPISHALDRLPLVREWGHCGLVVARRVET